jgi:hypothetical protein
MADDQKSARIFGVLFIITFLTSIPALLLSSPLRGSAVVRMTAALLARDGHR